MILRGPETLFLPAELTFPDMPSGITSSFLLLVAVLGPVGGGPQTGLRPDMTDQELFWGTDQYDFSVVLPAAGLECFWHFAHRGERFYLSFMVRGTPGSFWGFFLLSDILHHFKMCPCF